MSANCQRDQIGMDAAPIADGAGNFPQQVGREPLIVTLSRSELKALAAMRVSSRQYGRLAGWEWFVGLARGGNPRYSLPVLGALIRRFMRGDARAFELHEIDCIQFAEMAHAEGRGAGWIDPKSNTCSPECGAELLKAPAAWRREQADSAVKETSR